MIKQVIKLYRQNGRWILDFVNGEEWKRLFGTTVVETPFSSAMPVEEVEKIIQGRNPEYLIMVC